MNGAGCVVNRCCDSPTLHDYCFTRARLCARRTRRCASRRSRHGVRFNHQHRVSPSVPNDLHAPILRCRHCRRIAVSLRLQRRGARPVRCFERHVAPRRRSHTEHTRPRIWRHSKCWISRPLTPIRRCCKELHEFSWAPLLASCAGLNAVQSRRSKTHAGLCHRRSDRPDGKCGDK